MILIITYRPKETKWYSYSESSLGFCFNILTCEPSLSNDLTESKCI